MRKIIGLFFGFLFVVIFLFEVQSVAAHEDHHTRPVTSPLTSPLYCRSGWGFGDKNHCHKKKDHDKHDNDRDDRHDSDEHHENHGHH